MDERHQELAQRLGMEKSPRFARLFDMIVDDLETDILVALPGAAPAIAEKLSRDLYEVENTLHDLFLRGLAVPSMGTDPPTYSLTSDVISFHDATTLWPGATTEYRDLLKEFMEEEWPFISPVFTEKLGRKPTRVIPIDVVIEAKNQVLAFEDVREIIEGAKTIVVTNCPCRLTARNCDKPLEVCLTFDQVAQMNLARGVGRELTKPEAFDIIRIAEEAGLVHQVVNQRGPNAMICNCCTCCCVNTPSVDGKWVNMPEPSRFLAVVDMDVCTACGTCLDQCPFAAIDITGGPDGDLAKIDDDRCMGCGVCQVACPEDAIALKEVRPKDFVPSTKIWK